MPRLAHRPIRARLLCLVALASLAGLGLPPNSVAADKVPKAEGALVRPTARQRLPIKDFEFTSRSPRGDLRITDRDIRPYAFSPDGKLLATMDAGAWQLELWDVAAAKSLGRFGRYQGAVAMAFSPDGRHLYTTEPAQGHSGREEIQTVEVWDVSSRRSRPLDEGVNLTRFAAIAVSPDGKSLALGDPSKGPFDRIYTTTPALHFWDAATGAELRRIAWAVNVQRHRWEPECLLAYSPSGRMLALVAERRVSLIEVSTGKERFVVAELPRGRKGDDDGMAARCLAFAPDGRTVAVGHVDGVIRLYDAFTGRPLDPLLGHEKSVEALRFTGPDALLSFGSDRALLTWQVADARNGASPGSAKLTEADLQRCWEDLVGKERQKVVAAVRSLAVAPASSVPFLRKRLSPAKPIAKDRILALLKVLGEGEYPERRTAAAELMRLGEDVLPVLTQELSKGRVRHPGALHSVAERLRRGGPSPDQVRRLTALQALEMMEGDQARTLLTALSEGEPLADLTVEAKAALARMDLRRLPAADVTVEALWDGLKTEDARAAFVAVRGLTARPTTSVPFLSGKLLTLAKQPDDEKHIARLIRDLADDRIATREAASKALHEMAPAGAPTLRAAREKSTDAEQKRRLGIALEEVSKRTFDATRFQADRALEALHAIGTKEARQTLADLAKEAQPRWLREGAALLVAPTK